ncbi:unnamed protein product [Albugo candida]|uniref:Uncharacterized protein n=1 Tax=Albugo candida TaxID=65357 RepID=A0A024FXH6_9STRA|nr:unnamed protein product [Albugo candida]|eukprot:CCI11602.1 unnamed protein product [Albugo candida]
MTPSGGLADSTHVFRPCVPRFESWRWQKGCDGAPRRRQRFLHLIINLLNEDMDVSRPLATTPENNYNHQTVVTERCLNKSTTGEQA